MSIINKPFPFKLKPEQQLQIQIYEWFCLKYPEHKREFHHFANERQCNKLYGYLLNLMGLTKGVSDIFIDVQRHGYRGLWMELKIGSNRPTEAQKSFLTRKAQIGYSSICVVGFDSAVAFIKNYLD